MRILIPVILLLTILGGCAPTTQVTRPPADDARELAAARQAMQQGEYLRAIELFSHLADKSHGVERSDRLIQLAHAQLAAGMTGEARKTVAALSPQTLPPAQFLRYQLVENGILLTENPAQALQRFQSLAAQVNASDNYEIAANYHEWLSRAYSLSGDHLRSANELIQRELYLLESSNLLQNQQAIWQELTQVPTDELTQLSAHPGDALLGWAGLALATRDFSSGVNAIVERIKTWRQQHPSHPATVAFLNQLESDYQGMRQVPRQIALLLPLSGQYAGAGLAIQDGIMAAYYSHPERNNISLRLYDVAAQPGQVAALYQGAVRDGAELVIGPLQKETVQTMAQVENLPVPVIALNAVDDHLSPNLYQFSLSPEQEAEQVAEHARQDGQHRASLLLPEGLWGERMGSAFIRRWSELGGEVVSVDRYEIQNNDFSRPMKSILNLNDSEARYRQLSAILGERPEFTPHRRQDIDFIFIAANPRQARLIRPQLKFHHAGDLPIYATSHVFSGKVDRTQDRDMDDIIFADIPWTLDAPSQLSELRHRSGDQLARHNDQLQRLVALGIDAFQLATLFPQLEKYPMSSYRGETGTLNIGDNGNIHRELSWAQFVAGKPKLLAPARGNESIAP